jgi:hypothetical protein
MTLRGRFTEKVIGKGRLHRKLKARREKKQKEKEEREKQFRKGFVHKGSQPKSFEIKPDLPKYGKKKRRRFF